MFAQFETLVDSTREFYTYLSQVLVRYDLDRAEFQVFKTALLDYLQRFVDEIARHMPQVAQVLVTIEPRVPALTTRANSGQRLMSLDGTIARRSRGLDPADWVGLHAWFVGGSGRDSDAAGVRRLATDAMKALLVNLRRIAASTDREQSRYADLVRSHRASSTGSRTPVTPSRSRWWSPAAPRRRSSCRSRGTRTSRSTLTDPACRGAARDGGCSARTTGPSALNGVGGPRHQRATSGRTGPAS